MAKKIVITGEYILSKLNNGSTTVYRVYNNVKGALREIAEQEGFEHGNDWTARQLGSKLMSSLEDRED